MDSEMGSSGARAMHGFGAICLLRRSRCVFLVLSTSVRSLEMPVDECPSCARGACPFLNPWSILCFCLLRIHNKPVLLYSTVGTKKRRPRTTTHEIPFNIWDYKKKVVNKRKF